MRLPDDTYIFGRVVGVGSALAPMPLAYPIYVYRGRSVDKQPDLDALLPDRLLLPPVFINRMPWTKSYFGNVAHQELTQHLQLQQYCWDAARGRYVDERQDPVPREVQPCADWGLSSYQWLDDEISDALCIPRAPKTLDSSGELPGTAAGIVAALLDVIARNGNIERILNEHGTFRFVSIREARLTEPLADYGLVSRRLLGGQHLMEVVFVRPMRIARLARERFKGPRDPGQFQRPRLHEDEITAEGGGAHAAPPREPAVVVGRAAARDGDLAEPGSAPRQVRHAAASMAPASGRATGASRSRARRSRPARRPRRRGDRAGRGPRRRVARPPAVRARRGADPGIRRKRVAEIAQKIRQHLADRLRFAGQLRHVMPVVDRSLPKAFPRMRNLSPFAPDDGHGRRADAHLGDRDRPSGTAPHGARPLKPNEGARRHRGERRGFRRERHRSEAELTLLLDRSARRSSGPPHRVWCRVAHPSARAGRSRPRARAARNGDQGLLRTALPRDSTPPLSWPSPGRQKQACGN